MNYLQFLKYLQDEHSIGVRFENGLNSNSVYRRAIDQGAVLFNDKKVDFRAEVEFPITSLVFFPNSKKKRTTII